MKLKFLTFIIIFSTTSCIAPYFTSPYYHYERSESPRYNIEIYCSIENVRVVVTKTTVEEVSKSIDDAIQRERENRGNEKHTILVLQKGRGVLVDNIPPRKLRRCKIRQELRDEFKKR